MLGFKFNRATVEEAKFENVFTPVNNESFGFMLGTQRGAGKNIFYFDFGDIRI